MKRQLGGWPLAAAVLGLLVLGPVAVAPAQQSGRRVVSGVVVAGPRIAPTPTIVYGYPGNYYQPTDTSYLPYAPPGTGVLNGGTYPVYSISYANPAAPGGVTTFVQTGGGDPAARAVYYGAGYTGYSAPGAMYSAGTSVPSWAGPTLAGYGPNTIVMASGGAANLVAPRPTLGPTGVGFGSALPVGNPGLAPVMTPGLIMPAPAVGGAGFGGAEGSGTFGYGVGGP